jgi:RIO kinase 1
MPPKDIYSILEHKVEALRATNKTGDERKVMDEVFDNETLMAIYRMMTDSILDTVEFSISTGKEGNVFLAISPKGELLALKIFRTSTSTFKRIAKYIEGDPRFRGLTGSRRKVIYAWTTKEFRNLQRMMEAGVRVPEPIGFEKNCLAMEYIGTEDSPAPQLREVELDDPKAIYDKVVGYIFLAYREARLVHGDLSEYNILMHEGEPVIIDCGQAMTTGHFNAKDILMRDIRNVNRFFRSRGVELRDDEEIFKEIIEGEE